MTSEFSIIMQMARPRKKCSPNGYCCVCVSLCSQVTNRPVLEQKQTVNVWQQIGAEQPQQAAQSLMKQNDNFGYKSRTQMLAQGSPQVNVWKQIGAENPEAAAQSLMTQNDNFGYKAPTQKLFLVNHGKKAAPERPNVWKSIGASRPQDAANQLFKQVNNYVDILR